MDEILYSQVHWTAADVSCITLDSGTQTGAVQVVLSKGESVQSQQLKMSPQSDAVHCVIVQTPGEEGAVGSRRQNVAVPGAQSSVLTQVAPRLLGALDEPPAVVLSPADAPPAEVCSVGVPPVDAPAFATASKHPLYLAFQVRPSEHRSEALIPHDVTDNNVTNPNGPRFMS